MIFWKIVDAARTYRRSYDDDDESKNADLCIAYIDDVLIFNKFKKNIKFTCGKFLQFFKNGFTNKHR